MEFVKNEVRIGAFRKALLRTCKNKTVLDIGTGSGIFSIIAEKEAGARRVIAIEKDERIAEIAHLNFGRNGLKNTSLTICNVFDMNSWDIPAIDVLVGELLSTWCVVEPQIPVFRHVIGMLPNIPVTIPSKVINYVEGVNATFGDINGLVTIPTVFFEFDSTRPKSKKLTRTVKASELNLSSIKASETGLSLTIPIANEAEILLSTFKSGAMNALRLSTFIETCRGVCLGPANELMPNVIVPLPTEINVSSGDNVKINIKYEFGKGWENFMITKIKKV